MSGINLVYELINGFEEDFLVNETDSETQKTELVRGYLICKNFIFYQLVETCIDTNSKPVPQTKTTQEKILEIIQSIWVFVKLILNQKNSSDLFIGSVIDYRKIEKRWEHRLFENAIETSSEPYVCMSSKLISKSYSLNYDVEISCFNSVINLLKQFKHSLKNDLLSLEITKRLSHYLKNNKMQLTINQDDILNSIVFYEAERTIYTIFFRLLKPQKIHLSDEVFTGKIVAANSLNIPVLEYQHGIGVKQSYHLKQKLHLYSQAIAKPNFVMVYDSFFYSEILKNGFYTKEALIINGISELKRLKNKSISRNNDIYKVLIINQPIAEIEEEVVKMLELFIKSLSKKKISIQLKNHPRQTEQGAFGNDIEIIPLETSVAEAIINSDLVIGFTSTALIESSMLGVKTFTIPTKTEPLGIHSILGNSDYFDSIKIKNVKEITEYLKNK